MKAEVKAEWHKPEVIIVGKPGLEIFYGVDAATAALFQGPFDYKEVIEEHDNLVSVLKQYSKEVLYSDELILNEINNPNSKESEKLKELARRSIVYDTSELDDDDQKLFDLYKNHTIEIMNPQSLVEKIKEKPVVKIMYDDKNTGFKMLRVNNPLYNQVFVRDQQITTDKGIILGSMSSSQRKAEVDFMELAFQNYGIQNLFRVNGNSKLEGGDFIPAGDIAFIGTGLRTNKESVEQILKNGWIGFDRVVVVNDSFAIQDEMHLDTYFNVVDNGKVAILEDRVNMQKLGGNKNSLNPKKDLSLDIYKKNGSGYYIKEKNISMTEFLQKEGYEVIPITLYEQRAYALNFLTVAPNEVIGIDIAAKQEFATKLKNIKNIYSPNGLKDMKGILCYFKEDIDYNQLGKNFEDKMAKAGVKYVPIKFNMMNNLYGSIHCLTQVISRCSN
jgi:arginine deiminase